MHRLLLAALLTSSAALATTFRVPSGIASIQGAINAAADGDEVIVDPGTYNEILLFGSKSVRVHSSQGASLTILTGRTNGPVVTFAGGTGSLIGFTIQGGGGAQDLDEGGGVLINSGAPVVEDNTIQNNRATFAGGGIAVVNASPTIRNNIIRNNGGGSLGGAGLSVRGSGAALITNNVIRDNQSSAAGGAISLLTVANPVIRSNTIVNNQGGDAGAISIIGGGNAMILQNLITGNSGSIGAIANPQGSLINNTISDNSGSSASALGGSFAVNALIVNNIISNLGGGDLIACTQTLGTFRSNLLFAPNGSITPCLSPSTPTVNKVADPWFVCAGDYHLRAGSPAIDSGDPSVNNLTTDLEGIVRIAGSSIDRGALEYNGPGPLSFSPASLVFDDVVIGRDSTARTFTLSNSDNRRATFCTEVMGEPDFRIASACANALNPGQSCSITVGFRPATTGVRDGAVVIHTSADPLNVALKGIGLNAAAGVDTISPANVVVGAQAFILEVRGSGFTSASVIQWNGNDRPTTYVNTGLVTASIPASDVKTSGRAEVRVVNPPPGGGASGVRVFPILAPDVRDNALRNGATYSEKLAAGSYAALFGSNFAVTSTGAASFPLPTSLGGVSVSINGFAAPLFYVSPGQINLQIPWETGSVTRASLILTVNGIAQPAVRIDILPFAPAILSLNQQGTGQGAILVAGTGLLADANRPANRTEAVEIYAVGLGNVTGAPASGSAASGTALSPVTGTPVVEFGNIPGRVLFAGLAPGFVGLYQVNVQLPLSAPSGSAVPVTLKLGDQVSNIVTMAIQ